jgi:glycosyltransferase involved in cell wall biosynthesis
MNIAHILPSSAYFPLTKHNGRYEWALRLARAQVAKGHNVTIYAAPKSSDTSDILWRSVQNMGNDKKSNNASLIQEAFQAQVYDIYHSHFDSLHYRFASATNRPIIATQHWFPNENIAKAAREDINRQVLSVPPTKYMQEKNIRMGIPSANFIHHGIDLDIFRPKENPSKERLIFVGRITASKGVHEAINLALSAGQKLDIVGKLNKANEPYWQDIAPLVDGVNIRYLGPKSQEEVAALLADAKALLFPCQTEEAFGLITVEAQACGTPVIISAVGASHELVEEGKTGFIVSEDEDYLAAIKNIERLDRQYCRNFSMQFDIHIMVDRYQKLYDSLLD